MRTLKLSFLVALILGIGATTADAASVDIVWQLSGTATTTVSSSVSVTGNIVITPTTPLVGAGSVIELSADTDGGAGSAFTTGTAQILVPGWLFLGSPTIGNPHSENVIAQGDLLGFSPGITAPTTIGTITVNAGLLGGSVTVQASGPADDIFAGSGPSILGEYVFNAGIVNIPEPTTVALLGLGLAGIAAVGRRRG